MTEKEFEDIIWGYYKKNRRDFPWRNNHTPYSILVSELMLQQTQTDRVVPKYLAFLERFPDFDALAKATLTEVLELWSGLGYNRRAKYLHEAAKIVVKDYAGYLPTTRAELLTVPGIGPYTAGAILVFSFGVEDVFIETNIRRVFIHFFFNERENVSDQEIIPYIRHYHPEIHLRDWYYALMDYGAMLGKTIENPNRRSKHYTKQSKFEGSRRQLRGKLLRVALETGKLDLKHDELKGYEADYVNEVWDELVREGLV